MGSSRTKVANCPPASSRATIEVRRYVKPDGWATRYWAVYMDESLLAVVVYKKGAVAVAKALEAAGTKPSGPRKGRADEALLQVTPARQAFE